MGQFASVCLVAGPIPPNENDTRFRQASLLQASVHDSTLLLCCHIVNIVQTLLRQRKDLPTSLLLRFKMKNIRSGVKQASSEFYFYRCREKDSSKLYNYCVIFPVRCWGKVLFNKLDLIVCWQLLRMCIETFIAIHGRTAMRHDLVHFIRHTSSDHYCEGKLQFLRQVRCHMHAKILPIGVNVEKRLP